MDDKSLKFIYFFCYPKVSSPAGQFPSCTSRTAEFTLRQSSSSTWSCLSISSPATWTARSRSGTSSRLRRSLTFFAQRWDLYYWATPRPHTEIRRVLLLSYAAPYYWATPHPHTELRRTLFWWATTHLELLSYPVRRAAPAELRRTRFFWATPHPVFLSYAALSFIELSCTLILSCAAPRNWAKPQPKPELRCTLPLLRGIFSSARDGKVFEGHQVSFHLFVNHNFLG